NGGCEIVSDNCSVANFSKKIDHQNVARLKNVNNPGVLVADSSFLFSIGLNRGIDIRPIGHEHRSDHAPDQALARIDYFPSAFELITKFSLLQNVPSLICCNRLQAREHRVGNFRSSIREALTVPFRRKFNPLLLGKQIKLRVCGTSQTGNSKSKKQGSRDRFHRLATERLVIGIKLYFESSRKISQLFCRDKFMPANLIPTWSFAGGVQ